MYVYTVCVYIYIYACIYIYNVYMYAYIYIYIYLYVYIYLHTHMSPLGAPRQKPRKPVGRRGAAGGYIVHLAITTTITTVNY